MVKNINKIKLTQQKELTTQDYIDGIFSSDRAILSKSITLIESTNLGHQKIAEEIIDKCLPKSGNSIRIGITGVPGVGKSTFIEAFGSYLIESKNRKVAVLAIDPSSNKSSGSILGDKTRMNKLSANKNAFIRPSPSSGSLGGVGKTTRESIILCEAAGFDTILIETVGVGQSETEVKSMVDFFLLLMLSGAGDELQGIKRGIMEMADAIFINKADQDNQQHAKLAQQTYKNAIHLFPPNNNGWTPIVDTCSALENTNIDKVWDAIESFIVTTSANNSFESNRKEQAKFWLHQTILNSLKTLFYSDAKIMEQLSLLEKNVIDNKTSPFKAAQELIQLFKK
jgi:GTPase